MSELKLTCISDPCDRIIFSENYTSSIIVMIEYTDTKDALTVDINKDQAIQLIQHLKTQFGIQTP